MTFVVKLKITSLNDSKGQGFFYHKKYSYDRKIETGGVTWESHDNDIRHWEINFINDLEKKNLDPRCGHKNLSLTVSFWRIR